MRAFVEMRAARAARALALLAAAALSASCDKVFAYDPSTGAGNAATVLTAGLGTPAFIAVDAQNVFWTNADLGTVMQVPRAGGTPVVLATGQNHPGSIDFGVPGSTGPNAVADTLYWVNDGGPGTPTLMKLVLGSGAQPTVLATTSGPPGSNDCQASAPAGGFVTAQLGILWANQRAVLSIARNGTITTVTSTGNPVSAGTDGNNIYWTDCGFSGKVWKVGSSGGTPTPIATNQNQPTILAVDAQGGGAAYWIDHGAGTVMGWGKNGAPTTVLASGQSATDLKTDGRIFWANGSKGSAGAGAGQAAPNSIMMLDDFGAQPHSLGFAAGPGAANPYGLAIGANLVYFTSFGSAGGSDGSIQSLAQ